MVNHVHHHAVGARVDRRRAIFGTAAALAGAALIGPGVVEAKENDDKDARLQAAPKPIPAVFPGTNFHVLSPGPTTVTLPSSQGALMGLHVDPSVITNFSGLTALAYPVGTAHGRDGTAYDLEGDIRLFSGMYRPLAGGARRHGTFALVWIDLYVPGSGPQGQLHDFNGGIQVSGLFWIVDLGEDAIHFSNDGRRATVRATDVPVVDTFQFGGPNNIPAKVSFAMDWRATGPAVPLGKGKSAIDPAAAFTGEFAPARATGTFSGTELFEFSFKSDPGASSDKGYAEIGREQNGDFLT